MAVSISEIKLLPVRRDKQISSSGISTSSGGGSAEIGTSTTFYDVTMSGFTSGSSVNPSIFFTIDTNTGFYRPTNDTIGVATAGSEKFRFDGSGSFHALDDIIGFSTSISDRRLKDNIENIKDGLSTILKLQGIKYTYRADGNKHFGMIAQDVQKILPEIIKEHTLINDDTKKYLTIRYSEVIPWLIEAIKTQQKQIHQLELDLNYWKNSNT